LISNASTRAEKECAMPSLPPLAPDQIGALRGLDTCAVADAIEQFDLRLRNEGFADAHIRCMFERLPPMVGYAVPGRIRTSVPPAVGHAYHERADWWNYILTLPAPRIVVMQDMDRAPGVGAFVGELHANIFRALDCTGYVTNGAVRSLPAVEKIGFHFFAGSVAVSRAFAHVFEFGSPVEVGALQVFPGDLLHGDRHGLLKIPPEIASDLPRVVAERTRKRQLLIDRCQAKGLTVETLERLLKDLS
jgi:4-hydroxy-4-methyl-2-oxoglutarate aldolase